MFCVPSVMILAIILESIPWCHLVSRHSIPGFKPEIHSTHLLLIVFASSLKDISNLCDSPRGPWYFLLPNTMNHYGRSSFEPKDHNQSSLDEFSIHIVNLPVLLLLHGLTGRNMLNLFDILIHASTTQKNICSLGLSLFSYFLALVYQLIVRSNCAFVLSMPIILVVRQAILFQND